MAENPNCWKQAEKIIAEKLATYQRDLKGKSVRMGLSLPRQIAEALRQAGLIKDGQ